MNFIVRQNSIDTARRTPTPGSLGHNTSSRQISRATNERFLLSRETGYLPAKRSAP